jgi:hypothetical protein
MQTIHGKKEGRNEETLPVFHQLSYYQPPICSVAASPFKSAWYVLHVSVIQFLNIFSEFSFKAVVSTLGEEENGVFSYFEFWSIRFLAWKKRNSAGRVFDVIQA